NPSTTAPSSPSERLACGSQSTRRTRRPILASVPERWKHVEVFPTPPLRFRTTTHRAGIVDGSFGAVWSPGDRSPSRACRSSGAEGRFAQRGIGGLRGTEGSLPAAWSPGDRGLLGVGMVPWGPLGTMAPPGRVVPRGPRLAPPGRVSVVPRGPAQLFCRGPRGTDQVDLPGGGLGSTAGSGRRNIAQDDRLDQPAGQGRGRGIALRERRPRPRAVEVRRGAGCDRSPGGPRQPHAGRHGPLYRLGPRRPGGVDAGPRGRRAAPPVGGCGPGVE